MPIIPHRKIFFGVASRHDMYRMFNRHRGSPTAACNDGCLFDGEWFEITQADHDAMFEILPPLWMRGDMFAMREFLTGSITSVFYALRIDGRSRWFHGYCDLSEKSSPERMRDAIVARESQPVRAMSHEERIEHIWSATHDDYRGYAGERWKPEHCGKRTILVYGKRRGTTLTLLENLTEDEIAEKLPVHLRHLPEAIAA